MSTRSTRSSRAELRKRLGLALLALLYACGFFGTALHEATVSHAVCEHGDVVDVQLAARELPSAGSLAVGPDSRSNVPGYSAGKDLIGHDHVHCTIAAPFHVPTPNVRILGPGVPLTERAGPVCSRQASHPSSFPLYLLAPNHSPPAI
jgi:hypothetical protein